MPPQEILDSHYDVALLLIYSKNTSARGYPMMGAAMLKRHRFVWSLWALYRLVVSSITFVRCLYVGSQAQPLYLKLKLGLALKVFF